MEMLSFVADANAWREEGSEVKPKKEEEDAFERNASGGGVRRGGGGAPQNQEEAHSSRFHTITGRVVVGGEKDGK